ncbi:guanylate kinase isoform X1 [Nilaparvata lugens]|uniref:guanylate kinase isoform X1 n=2 Tax=Nilaparvata lugens TaxID=108931 RepID=UPI00193E3182|nr:guanylate kinase isoform X1 [Nilaparvata lugens]
MLFFKGALKMVHQGCKVLVVSGPSGSGKSTLLTKLFQEFPNTFGFSVSHTTRKPRDGEKGGIDYHFTTKEDMEKAISRGEFLESAVFANNMYGTSFAAIQAVCNEKKVCVLDIDIQGVKQVKNTDLDAVYVFIKPPNMEELEQRLRNRGSETEESLQSRIKAAKADMSYGEEPGNFDLVLVNDSVNNSYPKFRDFVLNHIHYENTPNGQLIMESAKNF